MFLPDVENSPGSGSHAKLISQRRALGQPIAQILHLLAYKTDRTDPLAQFSQAVMRGPSPLTPAQRELIATFTSHRNRCNFCFRSHAAAAANMLGEGGRDVVDAVLRDYATAPIEPRLKALLKFIEKVNRAASDIEQADVAAVRAAGWSDEAIYDAITVCAMFNFFNRWVSASGVDDMTEGAYQITGRRLATEGYIPGGIPQGGEPAGSP
jgi:uncharacterized peroxidase-related enzyme